VRNNAIGLPVLAQIADATSWRWAIAALLVPLAVLVAGTYWLPLQTGVGNVRLSLDMRDYLVHYRYVLSNWETNWILGGYAIRSIAWFSANLFVAAYAITLYGFDANQVSLLLVLSGSMYFIATNLAPWPHASSCHASSGSCLSSYCSPTS
jgi:predicted MFS family arabinose efflux permease